ncbi:MAG: hypothetical protein B7Z43_10800 [Sphingomonas sp. 12-62-6]|nr:MAG: hypothetical protein B7Z43_10800 [Sphingomonas sp. 12-62-6]
MLQGVKRTVLACAIMLPALTPSNAATIQNASTVMAPTRDQDRRDIEQLVVQFKAALSAKDAVALTALFYDGNVVWLASAHPSSRAFVAERTGKPVPAIQNEGAIKLLEQARTASISIEERFYSPSLTSDGQIATLTFDYDFRANDTVQNWGHESWQLVKTEAGWRILHLLFSYTIQGIAPSPHGTTANR